MLNEGLISLSSPTKLDSSKPLPDRIKFLNWGDNQTKRFGVVKVNEVTLAALPGNQQRLGFDHVVVDFQHNSVLGTPYYKGEPVALAARSGTPLVIKGEGLFIDKPDWNITKEEAANYIDLSAAVKRDKAGNVIFMHSGALCRQGEVDGITLPLAADPLQPSTDNRQLDTGIMDYKKLLLTMLGLSAECSDAEIETAATKFAGAKDGGGSDATLTALSARFDRMEKDSTAKITALEKGIEQRDRDAITAQAVREGKVIPLAALPDKDGAGGLPVEKLRSLVAELPVTVPLDQRTSEKVVALAASGVNAGQPTAEEAVRKQLGISDETWKKHNPTK